MSRRRGSMTTMPLVVGNQSEPSRIFQPASVGPDALAAQHAVGVP